MKKYKCMNIGNCDHSNNGTEFEIAEGEELRCPKCGSDMIVEVKKTPIGKYAAIVAAVVVVLGGAGFGIWKFISGPNPKDYKISLDQKELVLQPGQRALLVPSVEPADAKVTYTWKSNDETIVTVNNGGEVQSLKKGETTIVLSIEENNLLKARCKVKVEELVDTPINNPNPIYVEKIIVSDSKMTLKVGEKKALTYTTVPEKHDETISSTVSDDAIITLSQTDEVVALKTGKATVTITADKSGTKAEVEVTVKKENAPGPKPGGNNPRKVNLGYGIYEGEMLNGLPHGTGTLTFKSSHAIDSRDSKGRVAEAGDYVSGLFYQGHVETAKWFGADGSLKGSLLLGRP
jgi:DNA-directed RNA polymerase subunit RPC12/RpoP